MKTISIPSLFSLFSTEETGSKELGALRFYLFAFILSSFVGIAGISWYFYQQDRIDLVNSIESEAPAKLEVISRDLSLSIFNVIKDVQLLAKLHEKFLRQGNGSAVKDSEEVMLEMGRLNPKYYQIRLLGMSGDELIRIDQKATGAEKLSKSRLQNKASRYYFIEGTGLTYDEVYISPIDLNIEHGKVEVPYVPMMRFIAPVFDTTGELTAIAIINYDAKDLLGSLEKYSNPNVELMLLNHEGYWLKASNPKLEWGFMFPETKELRFRSVYAEAWSKIDGQVSGKFFDEAGIFSFKTVNFSDIAKNSKLFAQGVEVSPTFADKQTWKIVSLLPEDKVSKVLISIQVRYVLTVLLIGVLILTTSLFFYRFILYRAKHQKALLQQAYYDDLTGIHNRASFMKIGEELYEQDEEFSLIFLDLDGFKPVNDRFGHQAGDKVLQIVSKRIVRLLREKDCLFRLGGDEFIVLLQGHQSPEELERIQMRIVSEVEQDMHIGDDTVKLTLTSGMSQSHKYETLQEVLHAADKAMYQKKHAKRRVAEEVWLAE